MGFGINELTIILIIIILLFGSKKIKTLGSDLGAAIKGFKESVHDENNENESKIKNKKSFTKITKNLSSKIYKNKNKI